MIYFMQAVDGGPIKIGTSVNVDTRRRQLESVYGRPLAVLGVIPGGRDEEAALHDRFSHLRLGRTEQFQPAHDLMAFIGFPLFVNQGPVELMEVRSDTKPVRLDLDAELHHLLRKVAADEGVSMAAFARSAVERFVREEFERRGLK